MEQQPSPPTPSQDAPSTPPAAPAEDRKELPRLFDAKAVALASLVGTPVAGGVLLTINALRLGQVGAAAIALIMGLVLTYSLLGLVGFVSRFVTPWILLPLGAAVMGWVASMLQGDLLTAHRKAGGKHVGLPAALLAGAATALVLWLVAWPLIAVRPPAAAPTVPTVPAATDQQASQPQTLQALQYAAADKQLVLYFPPVTEEDARRVGQALLAIGYFDKTGANPRQVIMGREKAATDPGPGYLVVMFPFQPGSENNPEVLKSLAFVAQSFARGGVPFPFVIRMVTPDGKTKLRDIRADVTTRPATNPAGAAGATPFLPPPISPPTTLPAPER